MPAPGHGLHVRRRCSAGWVFLAALLANAPALALDPAARPGSMLHIEVPRRPVAPEVPAARVGENLAAAATASITPPAAMAAPGGVDEAMIRGFLAPRIARFRLRPEDAAGFVAAYAAREGRPYFLQERDGATQLSAKVAALAETLQAAGAEGLDAARLGAQLPPLLEGRIDPERRGEIELAAAFSAYLYARDARGGRVEPSRLSPLITPTLYLPTPAEVLDAIEAVAASGVRAVLEAYNPPHPGYRRLKAELELVRLVDPSRPLLTANLAATPSAPRPEGALPAAFMAGRGSDAEAGTGEQQALRNTLLVNMERWRWLPPDLGARHVFVNIPAFELKVYEAGAAVHEARVIVGKAATQTPVFSDIFAHVIVNPSWFVPPSILRKEFLPGLAADPSYAERRGFVVVQTRKGISVRQPPGESNALGQVKFVFPNRHSVYLHDTPSRSLFGGGTRAFSHGCVRVDRPFALAEKLLSQSGGYSGAQLRAMVGRGERMIKLADKVKVHLGYFTLVVDEKGVLHRHRDLYGHDARLRAALAL